MINFKCKALITTRFYSTFKKIPFNIQNNTKNCGQGWIRTTELRRGQIYSLLPLATWLLARHSCMRRIVITTNLTPPASSPITFKEASPPFGGASSPPPFRSGPAPPLLSQRRDSNPRPADYKSAALPTELLWLVTHPKR